MGKTPAQRMLALSITIKTRHSVSYGIVQASHVMQSVAMLIVVVLNVVAPSEMSLMSSLRLWHK
jgi:hypothetical protein